MQNDGEIDFQASLPQSKDIEPSQDPHEHPDYLLAAYHYELPPSLIAQNPVVPRDSSRLLVVDSPISYQHSYFRDLPDFLCAGDLLVLNNTRVIPARLYGYKPSGAKVEVLLLEQYQPDQWLALVKPGRRLKPGSSIYFGHGFGHDLDEPAVLTARIDAADQQTGSRLLTFSSTTGESVEQLLATLGQLPLPPYITSAKSHPDQYQTIYAQTPGAIAAPTAGLHFTSTLFHHLAERGIQTAEVTLHVGVGTFRPVETANITQHSMHREWAELSAETVALIQQTKARGGRVFAVGTTTTRTLEGVFTHLGELKPYQGNINLFIYPGYRWQVIDGLITNFHLPGSSLLMLVSGLIGRRRLMALYQEAIQASYRFYSFGDAMLILPEATLAKGTPHYTPASSSTSPTEIAHSNVLTNLQSDLVAD